jgi:uncharacterized protein (TIGR02186 family)
MRARCCFGLPVAALVLAGSATPLRCERLVVSLSTHRVLINSSFTGVDLVLFGTVEREPGRDPPPAGYDIVATITGPREDMVARRKGRVLGIWVNVESRTFVDAPTYLAVLSNRLLTAIASPQVLHRLKIGLGQFPLQGSEAGGAPEDDAFRTAFIEFNRQHGVYREETNGIAFLTPDLFRATIKLPGGVPVGTYDVDVKLFAAGALLAQQDTTLETVKVGFEQLVASAAHEHGALYGLVTVLLALLTGWFGSVLFRRD